MQITSSAKIVLSVSGIAGVASAVSVPFALKRDNLSSKDIQSEKQSELSIVKCDSSNKKSNASINFGNQQPRNVCGEIESEGSNIKTPEPYTNFFKARGDLKDEKWGNKKKSHSNGVTECLDKDNKSIGKIFRDSNSSDLVHYLGLCDSSTSDKISFIKKRKEPTALGRGEKGVLLSCENNCGKTNPGLLNGSEILFTEEERDNGKEVKFYPKKDS